LTDDAESVLTRFEEIMQVSATIVEAVRDINIRMEDSEITGLSFVRILNAVNGMPMNTIVKLLT